MATSTIKKDNSVMTSSKNLQAGVNLYRRGNVVTIQVGNKSMSANTVTNFGTVPSGLEPPVTLYARGISSGIVDYLRVDADGKVYGYRETAGNLNASISYGIV